MKLRTTLQAALTGVVLSLVAPITPLLSTVGADSAPNVYFQPVSAAAGKGSDFSLALHLNANGTPINGVDIVVTLPTALVSYQGLDKSGSYFDTMLPATPALKGNKVTFSAASLAGPTSGDELIATLTFSAKVDSGTANISLDGSKAAYSGKPIDLATSAANINLSGSTGTTSTSSVGISGIKVSAITLTGGTVQWKTTVATTGTVDYGADQNYGLTAGDGTSSTDHSVNLGSKLASTETVHFRVTSVDAQGNRQSSSDQTFMTLGYTVRIQLVDKQAHPQAGASLTVGSSSPVKTDSGGYATVHNVAAGSQKVTFDGKSQSIAVKALTTSDAATTPQQFKLVATPSAPVGIYVGIAVVLALLATLGAVLYRLPSKSQDKPAA